MRILPGWILGLAILAWVLHARHYLPFLADDALISLRYARRLLDGHGLTWTDGPPVEGYSNLLWILSVASLGGLGLDPIDAARALGFAGMGATIFALSFRRLERPLSLAASLGTFVLAGSVAVWTVGGLEQPFVAATLSWAIVLARPLLERGGARFLPALWPGLLLALGCLTRPDGPLFVVAAAAALALVHGASRRAASVLAGLCVLPAVFSAGQLLFRWSYYDDWIPNTARIKFVSTGEHPSIGVVYLWNELAALSPITVAAVLGALYAARDPARRAWCLLLLVLAASWGAYLVRIEGDVFPAHRQSIPLLVLFALAIGEGIARLEERLRRGRSRVIATLGMLALLACHAFRQRADRQNLRAAFERWEWQGEVVGHMFRRGFAHERPTLAVDAAGCLPYWSELPCIDMLGLNDRHIARTRPGEGALGHRFGDGSYVLDREPDLIVFGGPSGGLQPAFKSGREMFADARFAALYTPTLLEGRDPFVVPCRVWVRRSSERIGIRRSGDSIIVPSYLIQGEPEATAHLDDADRFVRRVEAGRVVWIERLPAPGGRWRIEIDASAAMRGRVSEDGEVLSEGRLPLELDLAPIGSIHELRVDLGAEAEVELRLLRLIRLD